MAKDYSFLARLVGMGAKAEEPREEIDYPRGMAEAAEEAKQRLKRQGTLQAEIEAQREINGRVRQFGKAA